jgi:hypothetical protein
MINISRYLTKFNVDLNIEEDSPPQKEIFENIFSHYKKITTKYVGTAPFAVPKNENLPPT